MCKNLQPGFLCESCPHGYNGRHSQGYSAIDLTPLYEKQECHDVNECNNDICVENSDCINTIGSFYCQCQHGHVMSNNGECTKIIGYCLFDSECDENAKCMADGDNILKCKCKIGWAGNGLFCGTDTDIDGWPDKAQQCADAKCKQDNCPNMPNSGQEDANGNGIGDVCDLDADGDGLQNNVDNCPLVHNIFQNDNDGDGIGDTCDNCPTINNSDQVDTDGNGKGDACETDIDNDGNNTNLSSV